MSYECRAAQPLGVTERPEFIGLGLGEDSDSNYRIKLNGINYLHYDTLASGVNIANYFFGTVAASTALNYRTIYCSIARSGGGSGGFICSLEGVVQSGFTGSHLTSGLFGNNAVSAATGVNSGVRGEAISGNSPGFFIGLQGFGKNLNAEGFQAGVMGVVGGALIINASAAILGISNNENIYSGYFHEGKGLYSYTTGSNSPQLTLDRNGSSYMTVRCASTPECYFKFYRGVAENYNLFLCDGDNAPCWQLNTVSGATIQTGGATVGGDLRINGNVGFYNTAPAAKQEITGSRGGNAALADLLTKLATVGLITDSTT